VNVSLCDAKCKFCSITTARVLTEQRVSMSEDLLGASQYSLQTSFPKQTFYRLDVTPYIQLQLQSADLDSGCFYITMHAWHGTNLTGHIRYQQ
jgi:hypothetical protein